MAAASPRKPRRTSGRHRKSSHAQWLRAGAVGFGLAAAIISGQGVASADTDDASAPRDTSASEASGKRSSITGRPSAGPDQGESSSPADGAGDDSSDEPSGGDDDDAGSTHADLDDELVNEEELVDDEQDSKTPVDEDDLPADTSTDGGESSTPYQKPGAAGRSSASTGSNSPESQTPQPAESTQPAINGDTGNSNPASAQPPSETTQSPSGAGDASDGESAALTPAEKEAKAVITLVRELVKQFGGQAGDGGSTPVPPIGNLIQAFWLASRENQQARAERRAEIASMVELLGEAALADLSRLVGWIPGVGTGMYAVSALSNLGALAVAVLRGDQDDIADEIGDLRRDLVGMVPVVGAPAAGKLYGGAVAAADPAGGESASAAVASTAMAATATAIPGTGEWYFLGVLQRAVKRLDGWPGVPKNFVEITTRVTDYTLDNANNQLDVLIANALAGSPAVWVPDLGRILGLFVLSAIPGYSYTDSLNAWGSFLNKVVPPFKIADGAGALDVISPYKIMGAAVVGAATLLRDMLNGIYDPVQWEINIIRETTGATVTASDLNDFSALQNKVIQGILFGGGGAFSNPQRAWEVTLPTWTAEQVNPYTLMTYVAFVGLYKRFQEMATLTTFTTWTTYDSWHYKNALGMYAAGKFHAVDPDGGSIVFRADGTLGKTYTTEGNALVTINTTDGGFTYTPPALWDPKVQNDAFFHRGTSENPEERFDWVTVEAYSADGVPYNIRVGIEILPGSNAVPVHTGTQNLGTDALGVFKGKITATDSDGDPLKYYLVESSVNGLSGNSAYTKNGAGNGGIVTLNENGEFTYVSNATAGANQSFQVRINDGHHGNTVVTITVPNTTTITPANPNTATQYYYSGTVPNSTNKPGTFVSYTLSGTPAKGTVTSFNSTTGAFTYHRNESLGHSTTANDVVTVIATTADGRQVTLHLNVLPSVPNTAPTLTLTTSPTVGTLNGTTQTSTGKFTYFDADGDAPIWPTNVTSSRGGTVTIAADGTFTYTSNLTVAERHAVARIGAAGSTFNGVALNAWEDAFTVTVSDGFGGTATQTVKVPIYAINSSPTLSIGSLACAFGTCTVTVTTTDPDGDNLSGSLNSSNNGTGSPWYTLSRGSVTVNSGNQHTFSWTGNSNGAGTQQTGVQRYTVYDGYYRVTNGVVDSGYFSQAWVNWNGTTRTTGN
ncbi:hypothetical protein MPNTM1_04433 [Mycolicibacterium parafortuitum]|uniref:Ig-like domain-containing protein n=1 Tax=Mycolicibacterium parafortuitum TaxID=39692 RepID=UPI0032C48EAC